MPVQLEIGDADVFPAQFRLPVLDLAVGGLRQLELCASQGRSAYVVPDSSPFVRFELAGPASDAVLVAYSPFDRVAEVAFNALRATWRAFAAHVSGYAISVAPELRENPTWDVWLASAGVIPTPWP